MKKGLLAPQNTFLDTIATRFDGTHSNFVLGNAQAAGCPVVYCSDGFVELTGFPRSQVMGRSCACKFLFGEETLEGEKEKIDTALDAKTELKTELFFYKKGGGRFKCLLDIVPIKNEKSQVVLILVSHKDIGHKAKADDTEEKSSSENDSDEEMAEAYRRCQARRGRASGVAPGASGYNNQRRRSRAVLYHLSGQFEKHNRATRAKSKLQQFNKFGSISGKMPEYKVQEVKKSKFILVHYGIFKIGWDWLILLCTFYTAILVPFNATFTRSEKRGERGSIYSDVVVEILFMFDILFNFRTSFVNKSGQVVYQARLIAINYCKGWFLLDLLAAIPFDFLYVFNINANASVHLLFILFQNAPVHLLKLARLLRLARLLQKIDRFSQYSVLVLGLLMSMFTLLAHWLACLWYAIGHVEFEEHVTSGWLNELSERLDLGVESVVVDTNRTSNDTVKPSVLMSYLSALYFTCSSLTSVGFGNVSANTKNEKIFAICVMIVGALMHAAVFGNVTALIQRLYQRRANFHSKTKDLKDFFRAYDIPKPLKQRMQEYFQTMWSMNNGIETSEILKDFPEEMKGELGLHLHKEILNLPIFEEATQGCLKSIALHTRRSFCAPGEFLVHKGDAANYLYFLASGSMEILKMDMVVAILGKGDLFGADIDFEDPISVCNYDVRSLTYSELQCINIKGLTDVLVLYPDFAEKFSKDIHNDLTYNLRLTGEDSDEISGRKRLSAFIANLRKHEEEASSSHKSRVFVLPSISEDDEISESDEDNVKSDEKSLDEEEETSTVTSPMHQSVSSPLLPDHKPKLPNGDISTDVINSPLNSRHWGLRRGTGSLPTRSSIKETRKIRLGTHQNDAVSDKLIPHIQNLQNEVEGTKSSISKLERKVLKIGQDICAIDRNMREILKHLTNASKINVSPLEPLAPPTPNTPYLGGKSQFPFDGSDTDVAHSTNKHVRSSNPNNLFNICSSHRAGDSVPSPMIKRQSRGDSFRNAKSSESILGDRRPSLLDSHSSPARRHSGPEPSQCDSVVVHPLATRTDYPIRDSTSSDYLIQDSVLDRKCYDALEASDPEPTRDLIDIGQAIGRRDSGRSSSCRSSSVTSSNLTNASLKDMLQDFHSTQCNTLDVPLRRSKTNDGISVRVQPPDRKVKKSATCGSIKLQNVNNAETSGGRHQPKCIETEISFPLVNIHELESLRRGANDRRYLCTAPAISRSYHESLSRSSERDRRHKRKTKSQEILETEFDAVTPNQVKTTHTKFKSDSSKGKIGFIDYVPAPLNDMIAEDASCSDTSSGKEKCNGSPSVWDPHSNDEPLIDVSIPDQLKTDSGNGSLLDTGESDVDSNFRDKIPKGLTVHNEMGHVVHSSVSAGGDVKLVNHAASRASESSEISDMTPDSVTDVSESLITDSVRTEDETAIDIEQCLDISVVTKLSDDCVLRTTDL